MYKVEETLSIKDGVHICRDKDLDILVNDEDPDVRKAVAERGRDKDLDILVNDEDPKDRKRVD